MVIPDAEPHQIGARLRWYRNHLGVGVVDFAKKCGVSQSQISDWENGERNITVRGAMKIYNAFEIDLSFIFLGAIGNLPHSIAQAWLAHNQG